jgi:hypothetical protein
MPIRRVDAVPRTLHATHQAHRQVTKPEKPLPPGTAGGDNRALRGIPAIGRGVTGAIPGTTPHHQC